VKGQTIQIHGPGRGPIGPQEECIINGTPKPGQLGTIKGSTASQGGRFTYGVRTQANGKPGPLVVFLEAGPMWDWNHAYANGDRGFLYWIQPGEMVNLYVDLLGSGTGTIVNIGQMLEPDSAGNLTAVIAATTDQIIFQALETVTDGGNGVLTPVLTWCQRIW
jgi:hypothetical protein